MPHKSKEENREYHRAWREKNREKLRLQQAEWRKNNKDVIAESQSKWYSKNVEKLAEYNKARNQLPHNKKMNRIKVWKQRGVIDADFDALYDFYIEQTNCMICDIEFNDKNVRCLDHDHDTGEFRYICCMVCNTHTLRT